MNMLKNPTAINLRKELAGEKNSELKHSFDPTEELRKELAGGHNYELEERIAQSEFRTFLKPDLLTELFSPTVTPHDGTTFLWDVVTKQLQRVGGRSYSEDGPSLIKDVAIQRSAAIPAFGVTYEVSAEDVIRRRKAGVAGTVKEAIADIMADQSEKMMNAYDIFNEDAMVELLVNDQNIVSGGPFAAQKWHNLYESVARPTAQDLLMGSATPESVRDAFNAGIDLIEENLKRRGLRARGYVNICGKAMFNELVDVEAALGTDYDIRPTLNLKVEAIPSMMMGEHRYRNFTASQTGVTHIQYQASMVDGTGGGGTPMIGNNDCYLIPVGVENMFTIELAPDVTLDNAGELAQPMYMYYEENRHELRVASSTNRLFMNRVPNAIKAFTTST